MWYLEAERAAKNHAAIVGYGLHEKNCKLSSKFESMLDEFVFFLIVSESGRGNKSIRADVWIDMCVHICVKLHYSEYLRNQINVRSVSARWILLLIFMGVLQRNAKNDSDFSLFFHIHRKNHCFPRLCVFSFSFFFLSHIFKSSSTVI